MSSLEVLPNKSEDLWSSYQNLKAVIWRCLNEGTDGLYSIEFETILRKHKQNFYSLLQNQPKNGKAREELKKGMNEGISIRGLGQQILSKELYQETLILSDMYDMNEFVALDLLCTAQIEMSHYQGLPRGLVAVLLYYEGRKSLVSSLRYLIQGRTGTQWSLNVKPDIEKFVTSYTNQLCEGGIFNRIFDLLKTLDLSKELDKLQENLALGGARHRRLLTDLFQSIRLILADCVFIWACQCGLNKSTTVALINYLKQTDTEQEASGKIDDVNLLLVMSLLSAMDLSLLHTAEDGEQIVQTLPILAEPDFISTILNELDPSKTKWKSEGIQCLATFGFAICISSLKLLPQNENFPEAFSKEESLIDYAIEGNVFEFLHSTILENEIFYKEIFVYKRMHHIFTDFIVYMYPKVKEMRIKADEIARTIQIYSREGLDAPPNLPRYFEYLLLAMGKFYEKDVEDKSMLLSFWSPMEDVSSQVVRGNSRTISLFKFIRLAGDMLPPTLFVPYLTFLSGLSTHPQSARHCFNLLKQMGPQLTPTLSWDHFFSSFAQYYNNLRRESPPVSDTVYHRNHFLKGVSPQELEGLHAVLLLMRCIAHNDEFSRLALCEHPAWSPLSVLLGLVGCSVPIPLKADLLKTLAALSKSAENASQTWDNLETSQILVTIPTTSSYTPKGIKTELDEIETRLEEYPLTRALLELLDVLTDVGIPRTLGAGPRAPGFDPYLDFIINSVFLKFHTRSYRNISEKWRIANQCLSLFEKFLNQYEPQISDFPKNKQITEFNSPPGYHLMIQLNNKTEFLNVVLDIIDEGNRLFDSYTKSSCQKLLEECTFHCLNIINSALILQANFFKTLTASSSAILLTNLSKLLLTINRRSGKPDHCVNIAKYISYQPFLLKHALMAIKILLQVTSTSLLHSQFMNIFLTCTSKDEIRNGFVLCLENSSIEADQELILKTKLDIFKLLKNCLSYTSPNLSHFLLGFDLKRGITKTEFQHSGVLEAPRGLLHSIISLMGKEIDFARNCSLLLEAAYESVFLLSHNAKTYGPVLRFLRLDKNFFTHHLSTCKKMLNDDGASSSVLNRLAWLMNIMAVELKVCSQMKQVSYLKQLTYFLVSLPQLDNNTNQDPFSSVYRDVKESNCMFLEQIANNFLISLIPHFECTSEELQQPDWQFFDRKVLKLLLNRCSDRTTNLIDLKQLHQRLYEEVKLLQGTAVMGQIQAITQEIPKVLKYALDSNKNKEAYTSVVGFVDAWRQISEILIIYIPREILSAKEMQLVAISFLLNLLKRTTKIVLLPEVGRFVSGTVLLVLENLKKYHLFEMKQQKIDGDSKELTVLQMHSVSFKEILDNLIEWIMNANTSDEKLKIHLYASLVTFLELISLEQVNDTSNLNSTYVNRLDHSKVSMESHLKNQKMSMDSLGKFGDRLVEVICQDCIGGYDMARMLALSSFSVLTTLSGNINWIIYMSGRGYLKFLIQSILECNNDLEKLLEPGQNAIKPLFVYKSKMLFFARLAATRIGAELLLEQKLFSCFSNLNVLTYHPEMAKSHINQTISDNFIPPPEEIYLQIWLPTLEISNAILTTLGSNNQSAVLQIIFFIFNRLDVVETILRAGSPTLTCNFLKELSQLTSIIARTATNDLVKLLENHDQQAYIYRLQKLMLALLPKFTLNSTTIKESNDSERIIYSMQVSANILNYIRNIATSGMLFQPTLKDPNLHSADFRDTQAPSLGIIIQNLIATVSYQNVEKFNLELLERRVTEISNMDSGDVEAFFDSDGIFQDLNAKKAYIYDVLSNRLHCKRKEMEFCGFIIEHSIYLIWLHLDFYMLRAIPKPKGIGTLASSSEATWKVSTDDISNLKHGLVSIFNDSFTKQLLETIQHQTDLDKSFVETMLKKIIRLIQFVPVK